MHRSLLCLAYVMCLLQARTADLDSASRIIGGEAAPIERYPYAVQILDLGNFVGAGTLISRNHALSSARLFDTSPEEAISPEFYTVRAGSSFTDLTTTEAQTTGVHRIVVHPDYNSINFDSDLAVLLLNSTMNLNLRVQTALLPVTGLNLPYGTPLVSVGWGLTSTEGTAVSPVLQEVWLEKMNLTECADAYERFANSTGWPYEVSHNMICAGRPGVGGAGVCHGDLGGPLVLTNNASQVGFVMGQTSWFGECGDADYVAVSVRLLNFIDWINYQIRNLTIVVEPEDSGNGDNGGDGDGDNSASTHFANTAVLVLSFLASLVFFKDV